MKRIAVIIPLLVCLAFGSADAKMLGDFNNDGSLTIADAIAFVRILMGKDPQGDVGKDYNTPDGPSETQDKSVLVIRNLSADWISVVKKAPCGMLTWGENLLLKPDGIFIDQIKSGYDRILWIETGCWNIRIDYGVTASGFPEAWAYWENVNIQAGNTTMLTWINQEEMGLEIIPGLPQDIPEPPEPSVVTEYLLYRDILGNAEFEADGEYPPPDNLDNYRDGEIVVTLRFGEALDIFEKDEVYGYMITVDRNPVNYHFKFVPNGKYWMEAEFVIIDSCFYDKSEVFQHLDTLDTVFDLHPTFLGTNMGCFDLILSGIAEGEFVQVEDRMFVARKVYKRFYRDGADFQDFKLEKNENIKIAKPLKRKR